MKKVLNIALLSSLLASCALADEDLLAKLTNGALSDNSKGVKVLSLDEMKEVKGGAIYQDARIAPILIGLGVELSLGYLTYLNAPTIGGPIYSGLVYRPIRIPHWIKPIF